MLTPVITDYGWKAIVNGLLVEAATEEELLECVETPEEARRRKALNEQLAEDQRKWREFVLR